MNDIPEKQQQPDEGQALEVMLSIALPPEQPAFAHRLEQLRDASDAVLTEDEYDQLRREILDDLVSCATFPSMLAVVLGILLLGTFGVALIGWYAGELGLVMAGVIPALLAVFYGRRIYRHAQAKNRLSRAERMAVVDELLALNLISVAEADELRMGIERLPPIVRAA
jgi:hypothetical protein